MPLPHAPASALARCSIVGLTAAALSAGCTLITDVDRSKIPAAEVIPPDPPPPAPMDAGNSPSTEGDAGGAPNGDAGAGDAGSTQPDAGSPPAGDAG